MGETSELMELLDQTLPAIDRHLARGDVPLNKRAELAVIEFATHFIQAVQDEPSQEAVAPGQLHDFVRTRESRLNLWRRTVIPDGASVVSQNRGRL